MADPRRIRAWSEREAIKQGIHAIQNEIEPTEAWAMTDELCGCYGASDLEELTMWVTKEPKETCRHCDTFMRVEDMCEQPKNCPHKLME